MILLVAGFLVWVVSLLAVWALLYAHGQREAAAGYTP